MTSTLFFILTALFIAVAAAMVLIILVQRPQGGGLAGAFGGAGGGGTDTVFGGRVGDALTWATVIAFALYLLLAIALNRLGTTPSDQPVAETGEVTGVEEGTGETPPAETGAEGETGETTPTTPPDEPDVPADDAEAGDADAETGGEDGG